MRYWFTINDPANPNEPETYYCDYAQIGCGNVSGTFVQLSAPVSGADHYLLVSFGSGAGTLAPGANSGEIQNRFNKNDWSSYNGNHDYSWASYTSYTVWTHVTVYYQGQLIWGTQP